MTTVLVVISKTIEGQKFMVSRDSLPCQGVGAINFGLSEFFYPGHKNILCY